MKHDLFIEGVITLALISGVVLGVALGYTYRGTRAERTEIALAESQSALRAAKQACFIHWHEQATKGH